LFFHTKTFLRRFVSIAAGKNVSQSIKHSTRSSMVNPSASISPESVSERAGEKFAPSAMIRKSVSGQFPGSFLCLPSKQLLIFGKI